VDQVDALTTTQISQLTSAQMAGFSTDQLASFDTADFAALGTAQFAALTTAQIVSLSDAQIAGLSTDDIAALTTAQARALTAGQIEALTTDQVMALETADLRAMTMTQYNAFEGEDWAVMSTAQFAALQAVTPIVLDLDGNGIRTLAAGSGVAFDIDATGKQTQTGWVGQGDGLLVRDINHDGVINNGTELFGGATQLANGPNAGQRAGDGFRAMADLDSNHDGKLSSGDAAFGELKLWVDANHDGKTDAGELKGLADFGVVSINLDFAKGSSMDNGNLLGMVSSYTKADGTESAVADVWFAKADSTPNLGELLAAPAADLIGSGGTAAHTAPAAQASATLMATGRVSLDDELLRNGTPLI
jgi:hypothetical protein